MKTKQKITKKLLENVFRNYNIWELAEIELEREGKTLANDAVELLFDRAITIRKWLDTRERNVRVAQSRWSK